MFFEYDLNGSPLPHKFYLARPNQHIIKPLSGIVSARLTAKLNDIWEIDFEVDKYLDQRLNPLYERLISFMEIKVDGLGWFRINSMPTEIDDGSRIYKTFTAYGYETTLQDIDLTMFYVNAGTDVSIEMYDENLNELGIPKQNIKLYIPDAIDDITSDKYWQLGLLNFIEHEYLEQKGWHIGHVDATLAPLRGRKFEIDSQTVYSFLTQDAAKAYRCMFLFDRNEKTINAYSIESIGKNLNIELSKRNVINNISIDNSNSDSTLHTRFRVSGKDSDTNLLEYINFGSPFLDNLEYQIENGLLSPATANKYKTYETVRESKREEYAGYVKQRLSYLEKISAIQEQMPVDEVKTLWKDMTDEELKTELEHFQAVVKTLEELHTIDGVFHIEESPDYSLYMSVKAVIIPDIQNEIEKRKMGANTDAPKVDYETNWELYGTNELSALLKSYEGQVDILKKAGYDKEWSEFDKFQQGFTLVNKTDYTLSYENNIDIGKAIIHIQAAGKFTGAITTTFDIVAKPGETSKAPAYTGDTSLPAGSIEACTVDAIPPQKYTGQPLTPSVVVKYPGKAKPINQTAYQKQHDLYLKYIQYTVDIKARLDGLNGRIEELNTEIKKLSEIQKALVDKVSITNPEYDFTDEEIADVNAILSTSDYTDKTIEILETDTLDDIITHAWDLYKSAKEQLAIESRPQLTYSIDTDNLYHIPKFAEKVKHADVGDFLFMELDNAFKTKQRVIEIEIELVNFDDLDLSLKFSDMITCYGAVDDWRFLLDSGGSGSSKNQITKEVSDYVSSTVNSLASQLFNKYISSSSSGGIFQNGISQGDLQKLQDALDGLIGGALSLNEFTAMLAKIEHLESDSAFIKYLETAFITTKELAAEIAKIGHLEADSAFMQYLETTILKAATAEFTTVLTDYLKTNDLEAELAKVGHLDAESAFIKYLQTQFLVGNQAEFKELKAKLIAVDNLLSGTVSAEIGHLIHLTAQNVTIDEAVIKEMIAAHIMVGDLQAGDIILNNTMRVLSENGNMIMNGNTMQFLNPDGQVGIQIGFGDNQFPSIIIKDDKGATIMTSEGITANAIADGLIKNDMLAGNISEDKLDFSIIKPNDQGGIDITKIYDGKGGLWGVEYESFKETTTTGLSGLDHKIEDSIAYRLDGCSSAGTIFKLVVDTTLSVIAYRGNKDITADLPESCFIWTRKSSSSEDDDYWNSQHGNGQKSLHVTDEHLYNGEGYFTCSLWIDGTEVATTSIFN